MKYMYMCQPMEHGVWRWRKGTTNNNNNNKPAKFMLLASINNKNEIINFPHTHTKSLLQKKPYTQMNEGCWWTKKKQQHYNITNKKKQQQQENTFNVISQTIYVE